jgi:hypothetical protein
VAERVLTRRELNRTTLARQMLLRRERISPAGAIERLAGLQAQLPSSPYLALWARLEGFERSALERALIRRGVVKALLMRATMHLVSARDYPLLDAAVREARTLIRATRDQTAARRARTANRRARARAAANADGDHAGARPPLAHAGPARDPDAVLGDGAGPA